MKNALIIGVLGQDGSYLAQLLLSKNYKTIARFLLARLVYNDALVTIFSFGGIYATSLVRVLS